MHICCLLLTWRKEKTEGGEEDSSNHGERVPETTVTAVYASMLCAYMVESHMWKWNSMHICMWNSTCGMDWEWTSTLSGIPQEHSTTAQVQWVEFHSLDPVEFQVVHVGIPSRCCTSFFLYHIYRVVWELSSSPTMHYILLIKSETDRDRQIDRHIWSNNYILALYHCWSS